MDANYKFLYVDVGAAGRAGDAGTFSVSTLKRALDENSLDLPPSENLQDACVNYHIIGDDAFPLSLTMMKPYQHRHFQLSFVKSQTGG